MKLHEAQLPKVQPISLGMLTTDWQCKAVYFHHQQSLQVKPPEHACGLKIHKRGQKMHTLCMNKIGIMAIIYDSVQHHSPPTSITAITPAIAYTLSTSPRFL
jgi:hypothetical protein